MKSSFSLRTYLVASVCLAIVVGMSGCQLAQNTLKADRSTNQEVQDYRDMLAPREAPLDAAKQSAIPDLQPYVADTSKSMKAMPLVSIAINQSIPLRDALFELAKQADYDLQLDPRIKGSIIYTARNKPYDVVISQISQLAGLRFRFEDDSLKVELDTPYTKTYKVEYLSFTRDSKSSIDTSTSISGGSNGASTGSTAGISTDAKNDFWGELDTNIKQILTANSELNYQITPEDPELSISAAPGPVPPVDEKALTDQSGQPTGQPLGGGVSANPMSVPPASDIQPKAGEEHSEITSNYSAGQSVPQVPQESVPNPSIASAPQVPTSIPANGAAAAAPTTGVPLTAALPPGTPNAGTSTATPQQVQLNVNSLPTVKTSETGGATYQPSYSLNKQAGLVSVYATQKAQDQIQDYLELLRKSATAQVLIEAKVLEVELNDDFSYGINWNVLTNDNTIGGALNVAATAPFTSGQTFVLSSGHNGLESLVSTIQQFGTIHALSSPRLTVINNQAAVLNVSQNAVYFELKADTQTDTTSGIKTVTVNSTIKNVPEGVLINVMPSIDTDRKVISMQVRPTISRIVTSVPDPGVPITLATNGIDPSLAQSLIPVVSTKEVDSVVNIPSGDTMVMGGLLEDRAKSTQNGIPVLSEIPLFGAPFRGQTDTVHKSEIVILLKATIIDTPEQTVTDTDRDLYRVYSQDRRPVKL